MCGTNKKRPWVNSSCLCSLVSAHIFPSRQACRNTLSHLGAFLFSGMPCARNCMHLDLRCGAPPPSSSACWGRLFTNQHGNAPCFLSRVSLLCKPRLSLVAPL